MDNISKMEKSFKNSIKALEDMLKIIQSLSDYFDNIDEDNDIEYFYNLLNKYNDTIGKIEIPGIKELKDKGSKNFKSIEKNINTIKKANNKKQFVTLAKNDFAKESMNCLLNDTKDAVSIIKNHIILLSKYIPLHIKLKKDLSTIDMYISNTKNKIMKKYNITNWNI